MLFGFVAVILASFLLIVVFYIFKKYFLDGKEVIEGLLDGDPQKQARIVNYFRGSILCCRSIISKRRTASRADHVSRSC